MKLSIQVIWILLILLAACTQSPSEQTLDNVSIQVDVIPDPPTLGESTLVIKLTNRDGTAINHAVVSVYGNMEHEGMLSVEGESDTNINGEWHVPFTWTMTGTWFLDVRAELADNQGSVQERFEFTVPTNSTIEQSLSDVSREFHVIIPEGTSALIESGQDPNVIPSEIILKLEEHNILVIQNNDSVDHFVGPFFIKADENIRQEFTRPAIYEGGCSIHKNEVVRIIIEE